MATGTGHHLSPSQKIAWLRLIRTPGVGPQTFRQLVNRTGSAEAAIEALPRLASVWRIAPPLTCSEAQIDEGISILDQAIRESL